MGRLVGLEAREDLPDPAVAELAEQAVAAKQEGIARLHGERAFQIGLDLRIRPHGPGDHVAGNKGRNFLFILGEVARGPHFPDEAVIEGQLLQALLAEPVDAAVTDMGDQGPLWQNHEGIDGGPHAAEFRDPLHRGR